MIIVITFINKTVVKLNYKIHRFNTILKKNLFEILIWNMWSWCNYVRNICQSVFQVVLDGCYEIGFGSVWVSFQQDVRRNSTVMITKWREHNGRAISTRTRPPFFINDQTKIICPNIKLKHFNTITTAKK